MINSIAEIHATAKQMDSVRIAVAAAADIDVLTAVNDAKLAGIADAILVGDISEIQRLCSKHGIDCQQFYRKSYFMLKCTDVDYELHVSNLSNSRPASIDA